MLTGSLATNLLESFAQTNKIPVFYIVKKPASLLINIYFWRSSKTGSYSAFKNL
jgi:hypothetical protein